MTWEQEMRIQVKEKSEQLAKEMAAEKVEETAKKLLAEKIAPEVVAKCTGLSLEQVKKLANGQQAVDSAKEFRGICRKYSVDSTNRRQF